MIYQAEPYYFSDTKDFPVEKAFKVTAKAIAKLCNGYRAELIAPKKGVKEKKMAGFLPESQAEKEKLLDKIFEWKNAKSDFADLFALFLYNDYPELASNQVAKFDHHDNACCCAVNLSEEEFKQLQKVWAENDLPEDLFYWNELGVQKGFKYYSPKQWDQLRIKKIDCR
jgi:16S rRNA C967 or C1407 C5-methylase (RsmB/RsmF family)